MKGERHMEGTTISRKVVIYENTPGASERTEQLPFLGGVRYDAIGGKVFEAAFFGIKDEDPAITCEIKLTTTSYGKWADYEITSNVQASLHHGIIISGDILPLAEDKRYVFYRHGSNIEDWIKSLVQA